MAFSACFGTSENRIGIAHLAKISPEIVQAIAVACEQLIQSSESWTYAFPIDVYKGGAGTSINMNSNEVLANLALKHVFLS